MTELNYQQTFTFGNPAYLHSRLNELGITSLENRIFDNNEDSIFSHFRPSPDDFGNIQLPYIDYKTGEWLRYKSQGSKWKQHFVRTRLNHKSKEAVKYLTPKGAPNFAYFNGIYQYFTKQKRLNEITNLVATEGEFKAFKGCKHNIPVVGGSGIFNLVKAIKMTNAQGKECVIDVNFIDNLKAFIQQIKPTILTFLVDADCFNNEEKLQRALAFFSAVKYMFIAAKKLKLKFVFAYINRQANGKGLDDILVNNPNDAEIIRKELLNPSILKGKYFTKYIITNYSDLIALHEIFSNSTQTTLEFDKYLDELNIRLTGKDLLIAPTGAGKDDYTFYKFALSKFAMLMPNNLPIAEKAEKYNNPDKNRKKANLELLAYDQFTPKELKGMADMYQRFVTTYQSGPKLLEHVDYVILNEIHKLVIQPFAEPRKTLSDILNSDKKQLHLTGTPFNSFYTEFSDLNVIHTRRRINNEINVKAVSLTNGKGKYNMNTAFNLYFQAIQQWMKSLNPNEQKVHFVYINHKDIIEVTAGNVGEANSINAEVERLSQIAIGYGFDVDKTYSDERIKEESYLNKCLVNGDYITPILKEQPIYTDIEIVATHNDVFGTTYKAKPTKIHYAPLPTKPLICFLTSVAIDNIDYKIEDKYLGDVLIFGEKYQHNVRQFLARFRENTVNATWVLSDDSEMENGKFSSYQTHRRKFEEGYLKLTEEIQKNPTGFIAKVHNDKEYAEKWTINLNKYLDNEGKFNRFQSIVDYETNRNLWEEKNYQKFNALAFYVTSLVTYQLHVNRFDKLFTYLRGKDSRSSIEALEIPILSSEETPSMVDNSLNLLDYEGKERKETASNTVMECLKEDIKLNKSILFSLAFLLERRIASETREQLRQAFNFDYNTYKDYNYKEFKLKYMGLFDRNAYEFLHDKLLRLMELGRFFKVDERLIDLVFIKKYNQFDRRLTIALYHAQKINSLKASINGLLVKNIIQEFKIGEKYTNAEIKQKVLAICKNKYSLYHVSEVQCLQIFADCFRISPNIEKIGGETVRTKTVLGVNSLCSLALDYNASLLELRPLPSIIKKNTVKFETNQQKVENTEIGVTMRKYVTNFTEISVTIEKENYPLHGQIEKWWMGNDEECPF